MDLEFVTSQELIDELMRRETFSGVVIDANMENERDIRVQLHRPHNMTALTVVNMLGLGVRALSRYFLEPEPEQNESPQDG